MLKITLSKVSKSLVDVVATSIFKVDEIGHMHDTRERRLAGPNPKVTIPDRDWSLLFKHENVPETWAATTSIIIVLNLTIFFLFTYVCCCLIWSVVICHSLPAWFIVFDCDSSLQVLQGKWKIVCFPSEDWLRTAVIGLYSTEILYYAVASRFDQ